MIESTEQEARRLHSAIYGPMSDADWSECRDIWMDNIHWLRENKNRDDQYLTGNLIKTS